MNRVPERDMVLFPCGSRRLRWMRMKGLQWDTDHRGTLFWRLQAIGWGGTLLAAAGVGGFTSWPTHDALLLGALRALLGFAITSFLLRPVLQRIRRNFPMTWLGLGGLAGYCGVLGLADSGVISLLARWMRMDLEAAGLQHFLVVSVLIRTVLYGFWIVLYFGIHYWLDTRQDQLRLARAEAAARSGELQMLRAQVNPHFVFNALNSILAESGNAASVQRVTLALADYLRFSLQQRGDTELLDEELTALENYLRVEKARFEENLDYRIEADTASRQVVTPVALVQPLLENAIKYGQRSPIRPLRITLCAKTDGKELTLSVENTGTWLEPESNASTQTGLANLRRRLHLLYADRAALETQAFADRVRVQVRLPVGETEKKP